MCRVYMIRKVPILKAKTQLLHEVGFEIPSDIINR